jgi:hypothetical protein
MYKDIITYELAENITEEHLLKVAGQIVNEWMKNLPGFIKWEINTNSDGGYTDVVTWASKADAENATKEMANIPNSGDWFACYKPDSISSKNLLSIADF